MKHAFRFWGNIISQQPAIIWQIEKSEIKQIAQVLKFKIGDGIEIQSPDGSWSEGVITELNSERCMATAEKIWQQNASIRYTRVLTGILKSADVDLMLPSLVELGVGEIHLFLCDGTPKHRLTDKNRERWQRIIKAACKQCKRASIPFFKTYASLEILLAEDFYQKDCLIVLDPSSPKSLFEIVDNAERQAISVVVGSESGLSSIEMNLLGDQGFQGASCSPYILRGLTAAVLAGSIASYRATSEKTLS